MSNYGNLPQIISEHKVECKEMMFYQYLPIKLTGTLGPVYEDRLRVFESIIAAVVLDVIGMFGWDYYVEHNMYLTAKHMYQAPNLSFNREGYHSDGFLTDDLNYIWSDRNPTIFNTSAFSITPDDIVSMQEMEAQAQPENEVFFPNNTLLRLDQYNIHKVNDKPEAGMRTFLKISLSKDRYDLQGNAHNYLLDYDWEMKPRKIERNIPQTLITADNERES